MSEKESKEEMSVDPKPEDNETGTHIQNYRLLFLG